MTVRVDAEDWKVLSLTHVEYQANDPLAKFFAMFSLLPLAVMVMFLTAFFLRLVISRLSSEVYILKSSSYYPPFFL